MAKEKNIQIKQYNGVDWDSLFPKTKAAVVMLNDGSTVESKVTEIVAARTNANTGESYDTIGQRLDAEHANVTTQLADNTNKIGILSKRTRYSFSDINRSRMYEILQNSQVCTVVGDSITHGGANGGVGWFEPLKQYFPNCTFINKGIGGDTTKKVLDRFDDILSTNADTYIIAIGTNDVRYRDPSICAMTASEYVANIDQMVTRIRNQNPNANIIFINAWCSFNGDYTSVLDMVERDNMISDYNTELRKYCANNSFVFIDANKYIKEIINFSNKSNFLVDYIHPNSTLGVKLYANAVLFGKQHIEDYGLSVTKTSGKYLYKLEIYNYVELVKILIGTPVIGCWSNVNNNGYDDAKKIFDPPDESYIFKPKSNSSLPIIITFSTNSPIKYLRQKSVNDDATKCIKDFKLYESRNQEDIVILDKKDSWNLLISNIRDDYSKNLFFPNSNVISNMVLSSNWSYRSGKTPTAIIRNNTMYINMQLKKSSAWSQLETAFTTNDAAYKPPYEMVIPAAGFDDTGSKIEQISCAFDTSGNFKVGWRNTNLNSLDCVAISFSYPLI